MRPGWLAGVVYLVASSGLTVGAEYHFTEGALQTSLTAVTVSDSGMVVATSPSDAGTWVVSYDPVGAASPSTNFVNGRFLRNPVVFQDGRLGAQDTGSKNEDFSQGTVVLDPRTGAVLWQAQHAGPHTFSSGGQVAAWMPCYGCATEGGEDPVAQEAKPYLGSGLTVVLENTSERSERSVSVEGDAFLWKNVAEVVGTGAIPLDEQGNSALVVWGGFPYRLDGDDLAPLAVSEDMGPVRESVAAPDGGAVAFGLDMGEFSGLDSRTGSRLWTTRVGESAFSQFLSSRLAMASPEELEFAVRPLDGDSALFLFSNGAVVAYSFANGSVAAREDLSAVGGSLPASAAGPTMAVSPNGRYVAAIDRVTGRVTVRSLLP